MTAEQLKVLTDSIENLLKIQFPAIDNWNTGLGKWEMDRRNVIETLINKIEELK